MSTVSLAPASVPASLARHARGRVRSLRVRQRVHVRLLTVIDLAAISAAVGIGYLARFQGVPFGAPVHYWIVAPVLVLVWLAALRVLHCYDDKVIGYGAEEYRRVLAASFKLAAATAIGLYLLDIGVSRGFLGLSFLAGMATLLTGRFLANKGLHRARRRGRGWSRRVLVVGDAAHLVELIQQLRRGGHTGYQIGRAHV